MIPMHEITINLTNLEIKQLGELVDMKLKDAMDVEYAIRIILEKEPCEDCISRKEAIQALKESAEHHANDSREKALLLRDRDIIRALKPPTPQPQKLCEDCISRQSAIKAMLKIEHDDIEKYGCSIPEGFDSGPAIDALNNLPSVTPEQKKEVKA